jgi:hypothetical protein
MSVDYPVILGLSQERIAPETRDAVIYFPNKQIADPTATG